MKTRSLRTVVLAGARVCGGNKKALKTQRKKKRKTVTIDS